MPWIKIQTTLIDDPAVSAIGTRLRMVEAHVVGCLVAIWSWADSLTANGFIQHATAAQVDRKAGKKGFAEAMVAVGWLRIEPEGVTFPRWDRHNGESAKARAGEAEAKRLARSGIRRRSGPDPESGPPPPDVSGQVSGQNGDKCPDQRREEEKRVENTNPPIPPAEAGHTGPDKRPSSHRAEIEAAAVKIYEAYPRKVGRADALKAIAKAIHASNKHGPLDGHETAETYLLDRTKAYAEAVAEWPEADRQYIPHPSTWFNGGRYDDDPQTWRRTSAASLPTDLGIPELRRIHGGTF